VIEAKGVIVVDAGSGASRDVEGGFSLLARQSRTRRGRWRRRLGIGLVATLAATSMVVLPPVVALAAGTTLFDQPFHNNTANGTGPVFLPALPAGALGTNLACLTAAGNTTTGPLKSCAVAPDAQGAGKLRLTDATTSKTGGLFGAASVPTSQGLDATFNIYQWGGGSADGVAFALAAVDPASPVAPSPIGQSGGALGYSGTRALIGLANGYLGIGFDVFGNYSTTTYEGSGCTDPAFITTGAKIPGQVVVRGPGKGTVGYCGLNSTATNASSPVVPLRAATRAASVVPGEVVVNPTPSSFTTASGIVVASGTYKVVFTPVGGVPRTLEGTLPVVPAGLYPSSTWLSANGIPRQLAFGFVGSTGSVTDNHDVDDVKIVTFNPVPDLNVAQTSYNGASPQPGDPVTYTVVAGVDVGADESSPISVTETLPTGVIPGGAFGSGWVCQAPAGQKVTCVNSNAPFTNGTTLTPITVVGTVASAGVTPTLIQTTSVATSSSVDGNPGFSTLTTVGTLPAVPTGITVTPGSSTIAGGIDVTVGGTNIVGATAIQIGTTAQQQAGASVTLLPCQSGPAAGCFTVNANGTLDISSMPARASAAAVAVTVVTRGVAGSGPYVYTDKPATIGTPTATAGLANATVSWIAPSENGSPITGYTLTPFKAGVAQTPISLGPTTTTQLVTGLTVGSSYTFTVTATNSLGTSTASPPSVAVVPYAVPGQPTITAASAGTSSATLTWTAPSTGFSPITSYVVTPYIAGVAQTPQTFAPTTTATLTGLTPGTTYTFTVTAVNVGGPGPPSAQSSPVTPNVSPSLANPPLPAGEAGAPYSTQLVVTGGTSPFVWSIATGTLPPGVTLAAGTGLLSGTPTAAGSYPFTVRVTDASSQTATQALTAVIATQPTLTFPAPPGGQVGNAYNQVLTVTGGTGPFVWSVTAGSLPAGLTLNASTGALAGTPTAAGSYSFTVRVVDAFSQSATRTITLAITARPSLASAPPAGQVGVAYSYPFTVTGGTGPFVWSVSLGSLPPGLTFDANTGLLAGTPTSVGSYPFTVRVIDATGAEATAAVTVPVTVGPLVIVKTANVSTVASGGTVQYSITVSNTGPSGFTGVTVTDPLTGVLDDATYNADAVASAGTVSFASPTLTWTGDLAAGATVTITYSVTVKTPDPGNLVLANTVASSTLGTNCAVGSLDARCTATLPVSALVIVKSADAATASPGDVVHYTVTVTNAGQAAYPAAAFTDSLAGVLDDAGYDGNATTNIGAVSYTSPNLSWTGALAVGQSATITYSVTISSPPAGNRSMGNTVVSAAIGNNCVAGGTDPRCTATVSVLVPGLVIQVAASSAVTTPGSTVGYTVTLTNNGQTIYTGTSVAISLAGLLDDAAYNADAVASSGAVVFASPNLTWTGNIPVGATVTVTYSATVSNPDTGDRVLRSTATSSAPGNNCPVGSGDARCAASTTVLVPGLTITKTTIVPTATPGTVVPYTITVTNTGQTAYVGATFVDSLAGVLDDAVYGGNATATSGVVSFVSPNLSFTGDLALGASATITYSVTVSNPDTGNRVLANTVVSASPGSNCAAGSPDARCAATVVVLVPGLRLTSTASVSTTTPGAVVGFTVTIANTGQTPYVATSVAQPLANVIDDAVYNDDATASAGTVGFASPTLTWTGDLAVGASVTVTFTVTVRDPDPGNKTMTSTLVSGAAGNNCPAGGSDPLCTVSVTVLVPGLTIVKTADVATTTPGGAIGYTIVVTNSGQTPFVGANFADSLSNVLNDAVYNNDAAATAGVVSYSAPTLAWTGDLAIGATASITYSVTVRNPDPGDKSIVNTVVSTTPGSNCTAVGVDPRCTVTVHVLVPGITISAAAGAATTAPGSVVAYTLTVTNSGQTGYTGVSVADALAGVLDDAVYNNDAAATAGVVSFAGGSVTWTGNLLPTATVTITFSVTVNDPVAGNLILTSVVTSAAVGSNCATGSLDPRCTVSVPIAGLLIVGTTDVATTTPGGVIQVTYVFTNTGQVPFTGISVAIDPGDIALNVVGNGDYVASSGVFTVGLTGAVWTGDIPVGGAVTLNGSVTALNPVLGDHLFTLRALSEVPGNNCPSGSVDPRCVVNVPILEPGLTLVKSAGAATAVPGATVAYTVTVTNSGQAPYTAITVTDPLGGVLDDATYNGDASATAGVVTFTSPVLTWTGDVAVGAVVTITYSVTVRSPDPGDKTMANTVGSAAAGSNCSATVRAAACTATVAVLTAALAIVKSANTVTATAGTTVTYTLTITNSGQIAYAATTVADSLAGVLDDALYNADASASAGAVNYAAPVLTWTGPVGIGATVTITYTVTVDNPDLGDQSLVNVVTSAATGSNCPVGGTHPQCALTVPVVVETTLTFTKAASTPTTTAGSVVQYTVTVANAAPTPYLGASFADTLAQLLDDADYNNDAVSSGGGTLGYAAPVLSWSGNVPATGSVVITYSVTVHSVATGDGILTNTVTSVSAAANCQVDGADPRCVAEVTVSELSIVNMADVPTTTPGGTVSFTTTMTNTGHTAYHGAVVVLSGADLLDDADPIGDVASAGTIAVGPSGLQWTVDIPVGATVTLTSRFLVKNPDPGSQVLSSLASSAVPGNNCPVGGTDPRCSASVTVLTPGLTITKTADTPFAVPGQPVAYTVTIANSGTAAYPAALVTDSLAGVLDDATYNNDATTTVGALSYTAPNLTWTGSLAPGAGATITYTMTVLSPDPGDKTMVNRVSSTEVGASCPPASNNPNCLVVLPVLTPDLAISTSAAVGTTTPGAVVAYTVTIVNNGQTLQSGISVTVALSGVLDDAAYNNDAVASTGTATFTSPNLVWLGSLAPGSTATVTYSVTVADPDPGNRILTSTVTSSAAGNNCAPGNTDPACSTIVTVSVLSIVNSADAPTTVPGATVRFTTTVTNSGQTPYTGISVEASFVGSLDDATYTGDAAASSGTLVLPGTGRIRWTGDLAVGAVLTVTGSFIVHDPDLGNKVMTSVVSSAVPGNNCPTGGTDPACTATVTVLVPGLTVLKTADSATTLPGAVVGYSITVTNTGQTPYTAAAVADSLSGVLPLAAYNNDAVATAGAVSYAAPVLTWTGDLAQGATVSITYSVTVNDPVGATRTLSNVVTSATPGSNCPVGGGAPACSASVTVLVPALSIVKTANTATATPASLVGYTITVTNTGQTPYPAATFTDTLAGVLDDATFNNDAAATVGVVGYAAPVLTWTGGLAVGASTVITYSVTLNSPATGDRFLSNAVTSTTTGSNCPVGGTDPACAVTVTVLIPALAISNGADVATSTPGGVIRFTAVFTNTGPTPYTGIQVVTNAANVFDDARPNGDQVASSGTLTVIGAAVTWTGDIPVGGVVTITGTVTVNNPDLGNRTIASTITTNTPGSNCPVAAPGPACSVSVTVLIPGLSIVKSADSPNTTPGATVTYVITATNTGQTAYQAITIVDPLVGVLDDASYNNDAATTTGAVSFTAATLTWSGDLPIGASVTITYTVTADGLQTPGRILTNTVTSTAPANNCAAASADTRCTANVAILIPGLTITKTADTATVIAGSPVTYTILVANAGQSAYSGAAFADPLTAVLDDATYNGDASASTGVLSFTSPVLSWTGDLAVGATATITYSVTTNFPDLGDRILRNTVTSGTAGNNCPSGGVDPACSVAVTVLTPALTITKTGDVSTIVAGGVVHYSIMIANTGQSPYTAATVSDALAGVLDDATYNGDATTTTGTVSYAAPTLTWTGDLPLSAVAVFTYSVTVHQPDTGDGHLDNRVTSAAAGSNCMIAGVDPRCLVTIAVAAQSILLSSLPSSFTIVGLPDTVASLNDALAMTVTTNSPTGYTVSVRALAPWLAGSAPGNTNTIPIGSLHVRETGTLVFQPLSDLTAVTVHSQAGPSSVDGDAISNDYEAVIPFIASDTYSVTLEYIAITQ
jgi:uncharacterized repeat protein (TIGR01451 family)